ncbi:MAG: GNAT family N-acetyltransferase [Gammaproteobacteria bacterium]
MHLEPTPDWQTEKIELFLLEPQHVGDAYVRWLNDPEINAYLEGRFVTHTVESTREFVRSCLENPATLFLGIRMLEGDAQHVGNIKISPIDRSHGLGEVGVLIGERSAWGKGIGSDAISAISRIAKHQLSLRKLTAGCYESNVGSLKAFEKAGFEIEATRRDHFILDGRPEGLILMCNWL